MSLKKCIVTFYFCCTIIFCIDNIVDCLGSANIISALDTKMDIENQWLKQWTEAKVNNVALIKNSTKILPGFGFPRAIWTAINRIRIERSRCTLAP